jgi:hypothetical protein
MWEGMDFYLGVPQVKLPSLSPVLIYPASATDKKKYKTTSSNTSKYRDPT